ncbi:sensor histidine kinase [Haloglomus litoreum]|uniref:sensor histidine kinase n=1 Tax=Haloglomus litoreum TaxID=3034026 RepID=UPI0023E7FE02|nr:ATP-binding protein [Haloglomus sp. DT116]
MERSPYEHRLSPLQITGIYCVFGVAWVLLSDQLVVALAGAEVTRAQLAVVKGTAFVVASGALIYGLSCYNQRKLSAATADLEDRIQQAHLLHRLLRHNLRNKCNVIAGHAEALQADKGGSLATIEQQTTELIHLSQQSNLLRNVSLEESQPVAVDLVPIVEQVVAEVTDTYPTATVEVDLPGEASVYAHPKINQAIRELLVNAIKHGGNAAELEVRQVGTTDTLVRVTDRGAGLPDLERTILEEGFRETQTTHSKGLGLWVVRYLVQESDGSATVETADETGTTVRLRFQPTSSAAIREFLR